MRLRDVTHTCCLTVCGLVATRMLPGSQQPVSRGSFIATRGRDTTSIERFSRSGNLLEGELMAPRLPWQSYRVEVAAGGPPRSFDLTIRPAL